MVTLVPALTALGQVGQSPADPVTLNSKEAVRLLLKKDTPAYPAVARVNYIQGRVRVEVIVSEKGQVTSAHVLKGHPFLAMSALSAIRQWVYRPLQVATQAVTFKTLVDFNFALRVTKLTRFPPSAEKDLQSQVTPPELLERHDDPSGGHVRMRVLVDSEGHPIDAQLISGRASEIGEATEAVTRWTFRPAYWGSMAVPWYTVVDVPVHQWPSSSVRAADPGGL
jgi:TonB family protein